MKKIDFKKELKHLYKPPTNKVEVVNVPEMNFLMIEITILEETTTNVVAMPIENPKRAFVVTARVGHMPKTCTNTGFSLHNPLTASLIIYLSPDFPG